MNGYFVGSICLIKFEIICLMLDFVNILLSVVNICGKIIV